MSRHHRERSGTADEPPREDDHPDIGERPDRPPDAATPDGSADHRIGSAGGGPYPRTTPGERDASQQ